MGNFNLGPIWCNNIVTSLSHPQGTKGNCFSCRWIRSAWYKKKRCNFNFWHQSRNRKECSYENSIQFFFFNNRILNKLSSAFLKKMSVIFIVVLVWSTKKRMWVSSVSPSPTLQSSWKKNVFKMLISLFLRLLCCQLKAAVAILHMCMYNNLLILKLPWLSRHARATVQTKFKLPITARTDICLKKKSLLKNIYVSSNIGSFGKKLEHALQCINNIHSVISASVYNTSHSCWKCI